MTMLRAGGLLDVLTPLSDCRHETVEKIMGRRNFGGFVYVLDRFPQRDFGLWVFMCTTNVSLFCDHLYCTGYHAQGYYAFTTTARLPRRGLPRPILTTTGYHAGVYIPVITPELSRSTTHVHRVSGSDTRCTCVVERDSSGVITGMYTQA